MWWDSGENTSYHNHSTCTGLALLFVSVLVTQLYFFSFTSHLSHISLFYVFHVLLFVLNNQWRLYNSYTLRNTNTRLYKQQLCVKADQPVEDNRWKETFRYVSAGSVTEEYKDNVAKKAGWLLDPENFTALFCYSAHPFSVKCSLDIGM